jgi:hypothetical protein
MLDADSRVKIYLARVVFEAGRAEDAATIVNSLVADDYPFQTDDRFLIVNIWQALIGPLRMAIMSVKEAPPPCANMHLAIQTLQELLHTRLTEIIGILTKTLIPNAQDEETKSLFLKALADFHRYTLECVDVTEVPRIANESRQTYLKAIDILKVLPQQKVELLMSAYLNFAILLADYFDQKPKAIDMLSQHHHDLSVSMEKYPEDVRGKIREIADMMLANIERWKPKGTEEEDG